MVERYLTSPAKCWFQRVHHQGVRSEHVTIAVTGARGGYTVDFRDLAAKGITLVGRADRYEAGVMHFANDLAENIHAGDNNYLSLLREADQFIERNKLDLPLEPEAHEIGPDPDCVQKPLLELALKENGVNTILWATGFGRDYEWLKIEGATDGAKTPLHNRGVSGAHGVYFVGLPWQSRRGSSFIWGSWHDAKFVADQIQIQRNYRDYKSPKDPN